MHVEKNQEYFFLPKQLPALIKNYLRRVLFFKKASASLSFVL